MESKILEYKEDLSKTFLKTVSSFANYQTGEIAFGINDKGEKVGLDDPKDACLKIENMINDCIDPVPEYSLRVEGNVVILKVHEGRQKPYLYKAKAYRRSDTSTVEVDHTELIRLVLEGKNMEYDQLKADSQDLSFNILKEKVLKELKLESFSQDTLKTLGLLTEEGYNKAAEILADENNMPGVDIVRFGKDINHIMDRQCISGVSCLKLYDEAVKKYMLYYQHEEIAGAYRQTVEDIPEAAFREAIANALAHRTWDVYSHISLWMFDDRIEITSLGGLPKGIVEQEYLKGGISILRNSTLGGVLARLNMIERVGSGVKRINDAYNYSAAKPKFELTPGSIKITLPLVCGNEKMSSDELKVYSVIREDWQPSSYVTSMTGFGKTKTVGLLKKMVDEGYIKSSGKGRGIKYKA